VWRKPGILPGAINSDLFYLLGLNCQGKTGLILMNYMIFIIFLRKTGFFSFNIPGFLKQTSQLEDEVGKFASTLAPD
jgi:hypothetical protein